MSDQKMDFAEELARFRKRTQGRQGRPARYDGLILVGTGQPTTGALLVGRFNPTWVDYLLTSQASGYPEEVEQKLGKPIPVREKIQLKDTSPLSIYAALKEWRDRHPDPGSQRIAVDVTGGKKPMAIGLAKAAYVLGLDTIYVNSDPGKDNQPEPGSQRLEDMPEPYELYGDLQDAEAARLWQSYDYAGAAGIFAYLAGHVPEPQNVAYQAYATLAGAYAAWDAFGLTDARAAIDKLLDGPLPEDLEKCRATLERQQAGLDCLCQFVKPVSDTRTGAEVGRQLELLDLKVLADPGKVLPLLGTLYVNGLRRGESTTHVQADATTRHRRYDMAALLLYRCLELVAQHRLATWGILTTVPDYSDALKKMTLDELQVKYNQVVAEQNEKRRLRGGRKPNSRKLKDEQYFGLFVGYMLLAALDDELVTELPADCGIDQIEVHAEVRNKSILAHDYRLLIREDYDSFKTVVDRVLDSLFLVIGQDQQQQWKETYTFVNPFITT
ncbi:MAG: TIGR02710 family CRISPR-associated CARF protein [Chloroflexia bacterium]